MDFDDGGVDHGVFHVWRVGAGLENPGENLCFNPVPVTLKDSVPVAKERREITPRASRPHDPKDRFDEAAVIASAAPGVRWLTQTMRFHLRPLGVCQYESVHPKLESQTSQKRNPESQQALEDAVEAAWEPCDQAGLDLITTEPTTLAGIISAIRYIQIQVPSDGEFMPRDVPDWIIEDIGAGDALEWLEIFLHTIASATAAIDKAGVA